MLLSGELNSRRFMVDSPKQAPDAKLVELLEKQKREPVAQVLKQHEEVQHFHMTKVGSFVFKLKALG
jgi:hypothetical protein